ncbi:MAG: nitroreductase, partial [Micromonosporaceae bacterium]
MSLPAQTYALVQAARLAGFAPSIHNTQPWHWRIDGSTMELLAEPTRQLAVTDPEGRMLTISCGAALHHVRVALAAEGWAVDVERVPDRDDRDLLARLDLAGTVPVAPEAMRLLQ